MPPEFNDLPPTESKPTAFNADVAAAELISLHKELVEQKEQNLHLAADFENFKRRTRQEAEARAAAQKDSFIHELLPVIDNLERALDSDAASGSPQLHQGVELTLQQLRQLLRQHGIETQESIGQPFDPHQHEAVSLHHDPSQPDHAILEVFQRGYRRGEKVFRPAKVVVNDLRKFNQTHHAR
ncbi:MAG: nucleotide exchange factor GrpE [Verrucomicrobiota bacterium]